MGIRKGSLQFVKMKLLFFTGLIAFASAGWGTNTEVTKGTEACSILDYADTSKKSWATNCPGSCTILTYVDEMNKKINAHWDIIAAKLEQKLNKNGLSGDMHLTLQQTIIKLQEILNSLMTEKEKFDEIEKLYNSGNIPDILAKQQIKVNELSIKRTTLQQKLVSLKKNFIEQTGFCKVSFKEYDEMVCDIISHATGV